MCRILMVTILVVLAAACESTTEAGKMRSNPTPGELLLPTRDVSFRLSGTELQALPAALDHDAVQELLSWVRPEYRAPTVSFLQEVGKQGNSVPIITFDASHPELGQITRRLWKRADVSPVDSTTRERTER